MKLEITTRNYDVAPRLNEVLADKLNKLDKYFDFEPTARVVLGKEGEVCRMEISVLFNGKLIRSELRGKTMYYIIDEALPKLERQIVKFRGKALEKKVATNYEFASVIDEDDSLVITKSKTFDITAMTLDEATVQLDMLGHDFYMFVNVANGNVEAVYKRRNGSAGHLQPRIV